MTTRPPTPETTSVPMPAQRVAPTPRPTPRRTWSQELPPASFRATDQTPAGRGRPTGGPQRTSGRSGRTKRRHAPSTWLIPAALLAFTTVPLVAGTLRLVELAGGRQLLPPNPRIEDFPAPLVVHVIGAAVYVVLGAFQFPRRLRRHRTWHHRSGRVAVVAGLLVAGSGLTMTVFYTDAPGGPVLWTVRFTVSTLMGVALALGFNAVRRHDLDAHRAWMTRAYALGLGAGSQTITQGVGEAIFGTTDLSTGLSISAGWLINAAIAEALVYRTRRRSSRTGAQRPAADVAVPIDPAPTGG